MDLTWRREVCSFEQARWSLCTTLPIDASTKMNSSSIPNRNLPSVFNPPAFVPVRLAILHNGFRGDRFSAELALLHAGSEAH